MADKKGLAAMIVSKMPAKGGDGAEAGHDDAAYEGKMACAEDMMAAMDQKDAEGFMKALEAFLEHR